MGRLVGIDLGTTNSVVAIMEGGEPTVLPLAEGTRLCPSVVGFSKTGERLVGQLAKRQAITNPDRTIASIKRKMGSDFEVKIDGKGYSPQEISAMILQKLKNDAEAYLGEPVDRAVITVPAYFNDAQRQATKDAGSIAGLEVLRIINEPTAAALAYGMDKENIHTILVWDLGGGTFDVSILELGEGVFEVKATNGDTHLGGDDWDDRVIEWLASEFQAETGVDLRRDRIAMQRLKEASEKAKIELSTVVTTSINLPFISTTQEGPVHLDKALTRSHLEQLTEDLRENMLAPTKQAIADSKLEIAEIDRVILVGGATRMPAVQDMVRTLFQKEPFRGTNPDEIVALGAAIQAGVLGGEVRDIVLLDVTPLSLGVETLGGVFTRLIPRNTTIPTSKTEIFTTATDGQNAVDINVLQGEREFASGNKTLGRFQLTGIPQSQRGVPKIEVTFDIDANGIVGASARDQATGREQRISITSSTGLTKSEIERMMRDAEVNANTDRQRRDLQDVKNRADALLYNSVKTLSSVDGKVDKSAVTTARDAADALRQSLASDDLNLIRQRNDALTEAMYSLSTLLYQQGGMNTVPNPAGTPASGGTTVAGGYEPQSAADSAGISTIFDEIFQRPAGTTGTSYSMPHTEEAVGVGTAPTEEHPSEPTPEADLRDER